MIGYFPLFVGSNRKPALIEAAISHVTKKIIDKREIGVLMAEKCLLQQRAQETQISRSKLRIRGRKIYARMAPPERRYSNLI